MDRRDAQAEFGDWYDRFDEVTMTLHIDEHETDDGDVVGLTIPARFEVCDLCDGKGRHVNPSIDAHGLTHEDFAEDPDFRGEYMRGVYDVSCYACGGRRVVPEMDRDALAVTDEGKRLIAVVEDRIRGHYETIREVAAERRWGY